MNVILRETRKSELMSFFILVGFLLSPKIGLIDISVLFLIFGVGVYGFKFRSGKIMGIIISTFAAIFFLNLFSALINQNINPDLLFKPLRSILVITCLYAIFRRKPFSILALFEVVVLAGVINSVVVLFQFFLTLRGMDAGFLRFYPAGQTEGGLRQIGLSSGYPSSGMLTCISAGTALYLQYFTGRFKWFFLAVLCLPGVFLSARIAVVLFLLLLALIIVVAIFYGKFKFLSNWISVIFFMFILLRVTAVSNEKFFEIFYIMFEFVFTYLNDGEFGVRSTDDLLQNHYFLPNTLSEWILGNSKSAWGLDGIPSDVWFVQNLVGVGLISTLLYLCLFFGLATIAIRGSLAYQKTIIVIIFALIFIASFKGAFIFSRFVGDVATLIGIFYLVQLQRRRAEIQNTDLSHREFYLQKRMGFTRSGK